MKNSFSQATHLKHRYLSQAEYTGDRLDIPALCACSRGEFLWRMVRCPGIPDTQSSGRLLLTGVRWEVTCIAEGQWSQQGSLVELADLAALKEC